MPLHTTHQGSPVFQCALLACTCTPEGRSHGAARWRRRGGHAAVASMRSHPARTGTFVCTSYEQTVLCSLTSPFFFFFFFQYYIHSIYYSLLIELHSMKRAVHCTCTGSLHNGGRAFLKFQLNLGTYDFKRCFF